MCCLIIAALLVGQGDWVGQRVITKVGTVLQVGRTVVSDEGRSRDFAVSGHDPRIFCVYRVERVNGPWLWLTAEREGAEGWVRVENVIPFDRAIDYFTSEIRANPSSVSYVRRGVIWMSKKEYDLAMADYNEAIRLDPRNETAYLDRGVVWEIKKEYGKAIADYNEAIRLDPNNAMAYNNRAWLQATCPDAKYRDGRRAFNDASHAYRLTVGKHAHKIGTLAAAYAECGDFDAAIMWQQKSQRMYTADADRKEGLVRLELYRAKKPYRQESAELVPRS
jgi:Tfp pilus assembly protein PilF